MLSGSRILAAFREAAWFDGARARAYLVIVAASCLAVALFYLWQVRDGLDLAGRPVGTDYASFWTASRLALGGHPEQAWDLAIHGAMQTQAFGEKAGYAAFFYPPPFLLACLPLGLLPYYPSLILWLLVTGAAWLVMVQAWLGQRSQWLAIVAFPAVIVNLAHGQNGFLTAALMGTGLLLCDRRPWLAGALLGTLVIKPHLAVLFPVFLLLAGNWRSFLAAGLSALGLCLASLAVLGPDVWQAFLERSALARTTLEQGLVGHGKMQSVFSGVRLMGGSLEFAWTAQGLAGLLALVLLWRVSRAAGPGLANGAALVCATLLTTPFLLDYDLTLLAIPLAWMFAQAQRTGFLPWERLLLVACFILPLVARPIAMRQSLPLVPVMVLALLLAILHRAQHQREGERLPAADDRLPIAPGAAAN